MADISRVPPPGGPLEPKKDKVPADSEKFKELMKVEKIRETDPEEQKKRKRREEQEEPGDEAQGIPQPAAPTKESILTPAPKEPRLGTSKVSAPAKPAAAPPPPKGPQETSPSTQEAARSSAPSQEPAETAPWKPSSAKEEAPPQGSRKQAAPSKGLKSAAPPKPKEENAEGFFVQKAQEQKKTEEEMAAQAASPKEGMPPLKIEKKKEKEEISISPQEAAASPVSGLNLEVTLTGSPTGVPAYLSPQVYALFERMVGVITVMSQTDVKETTITLNSPEFASSIFFGSQIIIQEYATAPLQYNIQITGNPDAVKVFEGSAQDLLASLNSGQYKFRINRLDIGERPLVRRKERPTKDSDQRRGDR